MGSSCLLNFLVCYNLYATLKINKNTEYKKKRKAQRQHEGLAANEEEEPWTDVGLNLDSTGSL